jgi:hypothetical protein
MWMHEVKEVELADSDKDVKQRVCRQSTDDRHVRSMIVVKLDDTGTAFACIGSPT